MKTRQAWLLTLWIAAIAALSVYWRMSAVPPVDMPAAGGGGAALGHPSAASRPAPGKVSPESPPSSATSIRVRALPSPRAVAGRDPRAPLPPGEVEFEVIDGLAVMHGDIILGKLEDGAAVSRGRHEPRGPQLWDKPEIPYLVHPQLPDPARVERALRYLGQHTPVKFVPHVDQPDAIVFETGAEHCLSALGRTGGLQPIRLSPGCQTQEILHEILHALGFIHEQSRLDRDQYVQVLWDNIEEKYQPQFSIVPETLAEAMRGTPFDYRSIMLYRADTFAARPGLQSLRSLGAAPIDPVREGLSEGDVARIKRLFRL